MTPTGSTPLASEPVLWADSPETGDEDETVRDEDMLDMPPPDAPDQDMQDIDAVEINAQLRLALGRRITVALLDMPGGSGSAFDEVRAALESYPEVRVLVERPEHNQDAQALEAMLAEVSREGADSLLVWTNSEATEGDKGDHACSPAEHWVRLVESVAERLLLFDRCFIALIGEGVSRAGARKLGYEDGFASEAPVVYLMRTLVHEALAREAFGRHGSSPPCYL